MKYYIYKISCNTTECFYIGSTNNFSRRKSGHKKSVNNRRHKKYWCTLYEYIRLNGNWDNFTMVIIDEIECETKREVLLREQALIDTLCPSLNTNRTIKK
jgi:predicted GIY-YIG superfamily endonuclease